MKSTISLALLYTATEARSVLAPLPVEQHPSTYTTLPDEAATTPPINKGFPAGCTVWFDGCNTCNRGGVCTMMYCSELTKSECKEWEPGHENSPKNTESTTPSTNSSSGMGGDGYGSKAGNSDNASRLDTAAVQDLTNSWVRAVTEKNDPGAITRHFCSDGILWGTVSQILRNNMPVETSSDTSAITEYFKFFANIPGIEVLKTNDAIKPVTSNVFVNNALVKWNYNGLAEPLNARMTFIFRRNSGEEEAASEKGKFCIFQLHSSGLPALNEDLKAISTGEKRYINDADKNTLNEGGKLKQKDSNGKKHDGRNHDGKKRDGNKHDGEKHDSSKYDGNKHDGNKHYSNKHDGKKHDGNYAIAADADADDETGEGLEGVVGKPPTRKLRGIGF